MIFIRGTRRRNLKVMPEQARMRRVAALAAFSVAVGCACLLHTQPAAQSDARAGGGDADAIVRRMISVYQGAQTLQESAEAKMQELGGRGEYIQTTQLKYSRANGSNYLYIRSTDPKDGTYEAYCNGKTITVYKGVINAYTKRAATSELSRNVAALSKSVESFTENRDSKEQATQQILNPISFLGAKGMPRECKKFQLVRQDTLDRRRAYVVRGSADSDWLYSLFPNKSVQFDTRTVTLWVDAENSTLLKAECDLRFHIDVRTKPKQPVTRIQYGLTLSETHRDIILNAPINDQEFNFDVGRHKGAVEKYQEHR